MAEEVILTREGLEELEKRLEYLKVEKRAEITERIKVAREFGDLSENAEYDAAKNEQAMIEGEILEIEEKLKHAKVIKDSEIKKGVVSIGSKVEIFDETYGENMVFEIVGTTEADVDAILRAVPEVVAYLRNVSPVWEDLQSGKRKFWFPQSCK